jgi:hypothetical protein
LDVNLPYHRVPRVPEGWGNRGADPATWSWDGLPALPPFILADGRGPARQQTVTRLCHDALALYVRFDCDDHDAWGTYARRDDPIYEEEVVEIFISSGDATPTRYYEFEVSPNGVLLDALIGNPTSERADLQVDLSWNCPGLHWQAGRNEAARRWWAILVIPWAAIAADAVPAAVWRANFFRIERPHDAEPEFSCWSPTMTEPADFHKPAYFGRLQLLDPRSG